MLMLSTPATQSRLNAAVKEMINLRISGSVGIPGEWDMQETMLYLESKTRRKLEAYDGEFDVGDKSVRFTPFFVLIQSNEF